MQVHFGLELLHAEWPGSVVCVGTFDGVHLGHRKVIQRAVEASRDAELPSVLVTFDRHPAHILAPDRCPQAIAPLGDNLEQFEAIGVAIAVVLAFDFGLSQTPAQTFLASYLVEALKAQKLVVGHDFAFGKGREGTPEWLQSRIETEIVPPFELDGNRVSSSAIRQAVAEGRVEDVSRLLGRPFQVSGVVVAGERLGRKLGYPTLNLARSVDQATPADGVYAGYARTSHGRSRAAVSIGMRPAAGGTRRTIEAYLLDYPGDSLYGEHVRLELCQRLREERDYPNLEALAAQIKLDVAETALLPCP